MLTLTNISRWIVHRLLGYGAGVALVLLAVAIAIFGFTGPGAPAFSWTR